MLYTTVNLLTFVVLLPLGLGLVALLALLIASVLLSFAYFENKVLRPLISSCCYSPVEQSSSIPQILLFMQFHLHQCSFLSTTCILPPLVPFRSQDSSCHIVLPTLSSSTSPAPFFFSTRPWNYPWLDRAPGIQLFYRFYGHCIHFCTYLQWKVISF